MIGILRRSRRAVEPLVTRRLRLVAMTSALLNAEAHDAWHLGEALRARLPQDWPPALWEAPVRSHILALLTAQPETVGWHRYMLLDGEDGPRLGGCVGGFPGPAGDVELGYSVASSLQGQGLATEAVQALTQWLFTRPEVHSVSAQAYSDAAASVKVMERCGMRLTGSGEEPGTVRYRCWR